METGKAILSIDGSDTTFIEEREPTAEHGGECNQITYVPAEQAPSLVENIDGAISVTGVTEASSAISRMADYSKHTDDELHALNIENLTEFNRLKLSL